MMLEVEKRWFVINTHVDAVTFGVWSLLNEKVCACVYVYLWFFCFFTYQIH